MLHFDHLATGAVAQLAQILQVFDIRVMFFIVDFYNAISALDLVQFQGLYIDFNDTLFC